MPRDIRGNPVKGNQSNEKAKDPVNKPEKREDKKEFNPILQTQAEHHDRLKAIEEKLGIERKEDGFKGEDQGGKVGNEASKPARKRH